MLLMMVLLAGIADAGDRTATLTANEEVILTWKAGQLSDPIAVPPVVVTEQQVFNRVVQNGMGQLRQERNAALADALWAAMIALTPAQRSAVLAITGPIGDLK